MDGLDGWRAESLTSRAIGAAAEVGAYLRGVATTAIVSGVSQGVYLTLLGVPLAGPLAVIVFLGGFVPYVGAIFTSALMLLVTFAVRGPSAAVGLLILFGTLAAVFYRYERNEPRRECDECGAVIPLTDQVCKRCGADQGVPERLLVKPG